MPTLDWLKQEFHYGYDSGNILSLFPNKTRRHEERIIGGSYRTVFRKAVRPYLKADSKVLELGPGKGAWSRAILEFIPEGQLHTVDFQDVTDWLSPVMYPGRLFCHKVSEISFDDIPDEYFDFFWSFGVLCHNNIEAIRKILGLTLKKMKVGAMSVHQYADWEKLSVYGWRQGAVPEEFQFMSDDKIWWPRNTKAVMKEAAIDAGWKVLQDDLNLVRRDSIILMSREK